MNLLQIPQPVINPDSLAIVSEVEKLSEMDSKELITTLSTDASKLFTADTLEFLVHEAINFGIKILAALAVYALGAWIIRKCKKILSRIFERRKTDHTLATFVTSLVSISLTVLLIIITIGTLGINTTSFAALLAAGGMAIGMAMSGTVQNFAGGIMILVFKPFRSGDYIEAQGYAGTVSDIDIFSTKLVTTDNKVIMIPNGALSNGTINNYSKQQYRRVEWVVGVEYGTDFEYAKSVISEIISGDTRIQSEPQLPFIGIAALSASSVDITIRAWVLKEDYWDVFYDYNAKFYKILPQKGINFPFPQMDVWMRKS